MIPFLLSPIAPRLYILSSEGGQVYGRQLLDGAADDVEGLSSLLNVNGVDSHGPVSGGGISEQIVVVGGACHMLDIGLVSSEGRNHLVVGIE